MKHIQKCLKDEDLKYAIYNEERTIVREVSQEYLTGHNNIIDTSKEFARQLFVIMKENGNIPSCDLITVSISTEIGPMLVILKMDYIKNYMHTIEFVDEKVGINILSQYTGLPGSGQRIGKCAFIKVYKEGSKYDLMVIDKKSKSKDNEEYGSNYFIENYLGCSIIDSERDQTKSLYNATEKWARSNLAENADKAEELRTTMKKKLREETELDVQELSKELFEDQEEVQKDFMEFAKGQGVSGTVEIDKNWVEKKLKRTRLKIDSDIDLYLNEEVYNDENRFEIKRNGDGSINILIKHIRNYVEK